MRNNPEQVDKDVRALELRRAGLSYRQIADEVGWLAESSAFRAVDRALTRTLLEPSEKVRRMECERLDDWLLKLAPAIERGEARSIEVALKVAERRAKLLGLDAPARVEQVVEVLDGSAIENEVAKLAAMLASQAAAEEPIEAESWEDESVESE